MKDKINLILLLTFSIFLNAQVKPIPGSIWSTKEYSKEIAVFQTKKYLFDKILPPDENVLKFEVLPLAAANSGELTTLIYKCEERDKEGMILGFYGDYWNPEGVIFQGFSFKNMDKNKAVEFLNKLQSVMDDNIKYVTSDESHNVVFKYEDMQVMVYMSIPSIYIRVFWNGFDSTWERTAFERSRRRFLKNMSK